MTTTSPHHKYRSHFEEALKNCASETWPEEFINLFTGEYQGYMNNVPGAAGLYYKFFRTFVRLAKPNVIVELGNREGCALGALWHGLSEPTQKIYSFDLVRDLRFVPSYIQNDPRVRTYVMNVNAPEAYTIFDKVPIDVLFCDTIHTAEQLSNEWNLYSPRLADQAIVFVDDINIGDKKTAFDRISQGYETLGDTQLHGSGFGIIFFNRHRKK